MLTGRFALLGGTISADCLPNVGVVARWMSSAGGGEVGRGGGTEDFLVGIDGGGGMLGGGGRDMVGGRDRSICGMGLTELVSSFITASVCGTPSLALVMDDVLTRPEFPNVPMESLTGDLTTLAAKASDDEVALSGDDGTYWNCVVWVLPILWKLIAAGGACLGAGIHSSV